MPVSTGEDWGQSPRCPYVDSSGYFEKESKLAQKSDFYRLLNINHYQKWGQSPSEVGSVPAEKWGQSPVVG